MPLPHQQQLTKRRRRYSLLMAMRVPCLIVAALTYHTPWLAVPILALSLPLPWCAVLIANDRPPRHTSARRGRQIWRPRHARGDEANPPAIEPTQ